MAELHAVMHRRKNDSLVLPSLSPTRGRATCRVRLACSAPDDECLPGLIDKVLNHTDAEANALRNAVEQRCLSQNRWWQLLALAFNGRRTIAAPAREKRLTLRSASNARDILVLHEFNDSCVGL